VRVEKNGEECVTNIGGTEGRQDKKWATSETTYQGAYANKWVQITKKRTTDLSVLVGFKEGEGLGNQGKSKKISSQNTRKGGLEKTASQDERTSSKHLMKKKNKRTDTNTNQERPKGARTCRQTKAGRGEENQTKTKLVTMKTHN